MASKAINKITKTTTKNRKENTTMRVSRKNEYAQIMEAINGIATEINALTTRVSALESNGNEKLNTGAKTTSKATTKKTTAKKTASKDTTTETKKSAKKTASKKSAPTTRAEAIDKWCEEKGYSEADRKAYGEARREIRDEMMAENKKMVKVDRKGNKTYDDNYYVGAKWTREFNRRMKERGFSVR